MTTSPDSERAQVIAFVGIDGSGKSTLAEAVTAWIAARGVPATYRKTASGRSQLGKLAVRAGHADLEAMAGADAATMLQVGIVWRNLRDARPVLRAPGSFAVLDRYTHCHLALTRMRAPAREGLVRELFAPFPAPAVCFFVGVTPAVALARLQARGSRSHTLAFLEAFDQAYRELPEARDYTVLDGDATPAAMLAQATAVLAARFPALA